MSTSYSPEPYEHVTWQWRIKEANHRYIKIVRLSWVIHVGQICTTRALKNGRESKRRTRGDVTMEGRHTKMQCGWF